VAVFAGNGERAVRALGAAFLRENLRSEQKQPENEQEPGTDLGGPGRRVPLPRDIAESRMKLAELRTFSAMHRNRNNCTEVQFVPLFQVRELAPGCTSLILDWTCNVRCET